MDKEEFAKLHYYLAKMKYELFNCMLTSNSEKVKNDFRKNIRAIERIEKIMFVNSSK